MRIICLHGMGTNSKIFEMQTAAIRYALGNQHTYEFVEGSVPALMAPGLERLFPSDEQVFRYYDESSPSTFFKAIEDLDAFIQEAGPFDGVMAFSQGAGLAASLMIKKIRQDRIQQRLYPMFKFAVFFCGGVPIDPGEFRLMDFKHDGELIEIPTAHIWGEADRLYPSFGPVLSHLCKRGGMREIYIHGGGHEIPGPHALDAVAKVVDAVNRTIDRAVSIQ